MCSMAEAEKAPERWAAYSKGRYNIVRGSLSSSPSGFMLKELRSDMQESGIKIPALTKRKARELLPQEDVIGPCETDPFTPHLEP